MNTKMKLTNDFREESTMDAKVKIKKSYINYGKGSPGYNYKIKVTYSHNNRDLAYASWPCVNCPTLTGMFRDLSSAKKAYDYLQDGEEYNLDELRPYFMEPMETYLLTLRPPGRAVSRNPGRDGHSRKKENR